MEQEAQEIKGQIDRNLDRIVEEVGIIRDAAMKVLGPRGINPGHIDEIEKAIFKVRQMYERIRGLRYAEYMAEGFKTGILGAKPEEHEVAHG